MPPLVHPNPPLTDSVVTLRAWREEEAGVRAGWGSDPEIVRWTGVPPGYTLEDAKLHGAAIESMLRRGLGIHFAVVDPVSDEPLGACDLRLLDDPRRGAEIGYLLGAGARGHGLITRALRLVIDWAFDDVGLPRVQGLAHPDNIASVRVLERLGFRRDGLLRGYRRGPEGAEDRLMFSLLARERRPPAG